MDGIGEWLASQCSGQQSAAVGGLSHTRCAGSLCAAELGSTLRETDLDEEKGQRPSLQKDHAQASSLYIAIGPMKHRESAVHQLVERVGPKEIITN